MVEVNGGVDGGRRVLPQQGAVLGVQQQGPVEDVKEQHHLIAPWVLTGHAQKHFLQQFDPQHLMESVQAKQLFTWKAEQSRIHYPKINCRSYTHVYLAVSLFLTLRLIKEGELCIDGSAGEGGQAKQVLLQQGDVGLLVHSWHVLCEGDEKEDSTNFF